MEIRKQPMIYRKDIDLIANEYLRIVSPNIFEKLDETKGFLIK